MIVRWVMKAPPLEELDDPMDEAVGEPMLCGENGQEGNHIPDLNEVFNDNGMLADTMALLPYMLREHT